MATYSADGADDGKAMYLPRFGEYSHTDERIYLSDPGSNDEDANAIWPVTKENESSPKIEETAGKMCIRDRMKPWGVSRSATAIGCGMEATTGTANMTGTIWITPG